MAADYQGKGRGYSCGGYRFLLFEDKREVELVWNGKSNEVCNVVLPFQTIEQIDEPRKGTTCDYKHSLLTLDSRGRQDKGWTNKLIWGDNKLILSSLKNGSMREEIERQGGLKLIYIDPPFDVGADFSMDIEIGGDTFTKNPNILEEIAYRDTWGKGADSFISMIYERLQLMRDLLAEDGSIYVHCDYRTAANLRLALDEVFETKNFTNEIIWQYEGPQSPSKIKFASKHDTILRFSKNIDMTKAYNLYHIEYEGFDPKKYKKDNYGRYYYTIPKGDYSDKSISELDKKGFVEWTKNGNARIKKFVGLSEDGKFFKKNKKTPDVWNITSLGLAASSHENMNYPTQKPEALLERIIMASSNEGDLVADFFCGSGTLPAVAEKLGRKWIVTDLGKFAIHTTRKRLLGVQRQLKKEGKPYRAFEVLTLGKYERQHYVGVNENLRDEERRIQQEQKEAAFLDLILKAYKAEKVNGFESFQGKQQGRMVVVGPVNVPVSRRFVEEVILECRKHHISKVDILGFEFEMGLFPDYLEEARRKGVDVQPKYIPAEVFDKKAVERCQVVFHDVAYIEVKPHYRKNEVAVELTDFSVFYSQDSIADAEVSLKPGKSRIVVERGQIVKVQKDKKGIVSRETLTKSWTDWIDYWSVDYDFESKREIIRVKDPDTEEIEEQWTGDYIFENEWQSFRTRQNRKLELISAYHELPPGRHKLAVKVVDIFGNDTMTIIEVNVGGKK